jgi:hypothetical protein
MGVQVYKAAKAPREWRLAETQEDHEWNHGALLVVGGDDPADDSDDRDDGYPVLDPYSVKFDVTIAFMCDDVLRDWIDAVGSQHGFSRSETVRRLVHLGITKLDGRIERVATIAQAEAA